MHKAGYHGILQSEAARRADGVLKRVGIIIAGVGRVSTPISVDYAAFLVVVMLGISMLFAGQGLTSSHG